MTATFSPIKRSAIHHVLEHHHAQFTEQNGWLVVTTFTGVDSELQAVRASVGVCDWSMAGKVEIKGKGAEAFAKSCTPQGAKAYRIHDRHYIAIIVPSAVEAATREYETAAAGKPDLFVIQNSSAFATFVLAGPNSERVLRKISGFNYTNLGANGHAPCSVAHTLAVRNGDRFDLHFPREYAEYIWETILDAGKEFHIHPFGTDTLGKL